MDRSRRVLGDDHPDTLSFTHGLAVTLSKLGKHARSRDIHQEILYRRRRVLGDNHPNTLRSMHNLSIARYATGAIHPARSMIDDTVKRMRLVLGHDHRYTIEARQTQAMIVTSMGGMPAKPKQKPRKRKK